MKVYEIITSRTQNLTQIDSRKVLENQILTQCIGIKITFDLLNRKLIRVRQNGEGGRGGSLLRKILS